MCLGSPGSGRYICSGALIAPNLIMTARHCVDQVPQMVDCATTTFGGQIAPTGAFWYTTYPSIFQNSVGWHQASTITTTPGNTVCGNDIALITLKSNVPSNEAVPVRPLVWDSMTWHKKYSTSHTAIGFGNDGTSGAGTRRIRQNMVIACIPGDGVIGCPNTINPNEFVSDNGVCAGDSGSSAYEQISFNNNDPITMGVASRAGLNGGNCEGSIYERTDKWTNLIVQTAIQAANAGGYPAPPWTVQPPPPQPDGGADSGSDASTGGTKMIGEMCANDSECASPLVCKNGICTQGCDKTNSNCPDPLTCQTIPDGDFCQPPMAPMDASPMPAPPDMKGGCNASGGMPSLWMLALLTMGIYSKKRGGSSKRRGASSRA